MVVGMQLRRLVDEFSTMSPNELIAIQAAVETTRKQVWSELHAFEDSLATYIYDLGLHITAGSFHESVSMARQLAWHLRALFTAHQSIHTLYTQHDLSNQKGKSLKGTPSIDNR